MPGEVRVTGTDIHPVRHKPVVRQVIESPDPDYTVPHMAGTGDIVFFRLKGRPGLQVNVYLNVKIPRSGQQLETAFFAAKDLIGHERVDDPVRHSLAGQLQDLV